MCNIICPPPKSDNPFTGSVNFKNVFFPEDTKDYLLRGAQPYRNMRHHLTTLENAQMANVFHRLELIIERETDTPINKFISHIYQLLSDFGSSTLRPMLWLLALFVITFLAARYGDGVALAASQTQFTGWRELLLTSNTEHERYRALLFASQNMVNPLGILGIKSLVVAKSGLLAIWAGFHSLLSVILITLFIFAVRRRFKLNK